MPWWVLFWINKTPLAFLVASVSCFSIGLCLFTFATGQASRLHFMTYNRIDIGFQGIFTSTITTILTGITSLGLAAVSFWFLLEKWVYSRYEGKKLAGDIFTELKEHLTGFPGVEATQIALIFLYRCLALVLRKAGHLRRSLGRASRRRMRRGNAAVQRARDDLEAHMSNIFALQGSTESVNTARHTSRAGSPASSLANITPGGNSRGRILWHHVTQAVRTRSTIFFKRRPTLTREPLSIGSSTSADQKWNKFLDRPITNFIRRKHLKPKVSHLGATQDLRVHQGLVKHLHFSPDGLSLVSSRFVLCRSLTAGLLTKE